MVGEAARTQALPFKTAAELPSRYLGNLAGVGDTQHHATAAVVLCPSGSQTRGRRTWLMLPCPPDIRHLAARFVVVHQ